MRNISKISLGIKSPPNARPTKAPPLSNRELEVLMLLIEGKSNQRIASELVVSVNTVKTHLKNIYEKLGVHGRTRAAMRASDLEFF